MPVLTAEQLRMLQEDIQISMTVRDAALGIRMAAISELAFNLDTWSASTSPDIQKASFIMLERLKGLVIEDMEPAILAQDEVLAIVERSTKRLEDAAKTRDMLLS